MILGAWGFITELGLFALALFALALFVLVTWLRIRFPRQLDRSQVIR